LCYVYFYRGFRWCFNSLEQSSNPVRNIKGEDNISLILSCILKTLEAFEIRLSILYWWRILLIMVYDNWMWLGAFCHLVDFVNISNAQLQFKNVSFTCSRGWSSPPPLSFTDSIQNRRVWGASQTCMYSYSTTYNWLLSWRREWNDNNIWDWIRKLSIPGKVEHSFAFACTMQFQLTGFDITTTWQNIVCMHNSISANKLRHHIVKCTSLPLKTNDLSWMMDFLVLLVTLVLAVYFVTTEVIG